MKSLFATSFALFLAVHSTFARAADDTNPPQFTPSPVVDSDSYLARAHDVVLNAMGFLGIPYRWGGTTPEAGFDCAGLVQYVFRQALGTLPPRSSYDMGVMGLSVSHTDLLPGDLV